MKFKNKTKIITLLIVTCLLLALVSFGYFYVGSNQSDRNRLTGGCFNTSFTDNDPINLTNAMPEVFDDALKENPYEFTLSNTCNLPVKYYILLNVKTGSFNPNYINFTLNETNYDNLSNVLENTDRFNIDTGYDKSFIIGSGLLKNGSVTKNLRLWIDENVNPNDLTANSKFTAQVKVVGEVSSSLGTDKIKNLVSGADTSSIDVIEAEEVSNECTNTLAYDGTDDNNLRYVGANPCNYVSFNNEVWRIIGVMNNIDDGTGKLETRLKIMRKNALGRYSFDTQSSGSGINDWTQADLMYELNGDYLNTSLTENKYWYNGQYDQKEATFNVNDVLNKNAQNLIDNALWNLGARGAASSTTNPTNAYYFYDIERSNNAPVSGRKTIWIGKIALMYPSDFGFATSGGTNISRFDCINTNISIAGEELSNNWYRAYRSCSLNDWIQTNGNSYFWLLTPDVRKTFIQSLVIINSATTPGGYINSYNGGYYPYLPQTIYPTIYLKANVSITGGDGSPSNMFTLG